MKTSTADWIKSIAGCGVILALVTSVLGGDASMQFTMCAFGCTYGGLWLSHV